jgi:hypothetical protein
VVFSHRYSIRNTFPSSPILQEMNFKIDEDDDDDDSDIDDELEQDDDNEATAAYIDELI